ncbi:GNAT family N-acetyltransferase [Rhodococcus tibetensis]|uniref:GNAT family N-acetyltransferase n=1 Tax=Rhodococcus tibetensis TaxID=2965064 RepID=A0ABT1QEE8_9NOCA|nr:GNAT family N-acetyltransferase [Rhodococcus sp. FXJ9.536]MCQ4120633.1 GNAT family N-acetyltransferase [Rhodococcus sp. FXJ9.536]
MTSSSTLTGGLTAHLLPSGTRPNAPDFAGLAEPDIIWEDARWCRFLERTDLHEVRYLEVREDGQTVALAPLLFTAKPGGLLFYDPPRLVGTAGALAEPELLDETVQQRWAELTAALPGARGYQYPSLALATFGNHHGVAHAPGRRRDERLALMAALPELLQQAGDELGCRSVAMLYVGEPEAEAVDHSATRAGYTATLLGAEGVQDLIGDSWEEYVAGLSKRRRVRLRKEVADYERAGMRTEVRCGPEALDDEVVALQVAHRAKYGLPGGDDRVRRDFDAVREELGDACVVLRAEREGRLVGFVLYLRARDTLFARTAGFAADARGCYLTLTYHETARWAVEHGIRHVHYGMAAYEAKYARGCRLRPRWGWFAFRGAGSDIYRETLALQSQSIERRLELVGAPAAPVASRHLTAPTEPKVER